MAKKRILVVDDEKLIRWSLDKNLSQHGYEVTCLDRGQESITQLQSEIVDLVLLDVHLPDLSGVDVLAQISAAHSEIPVIMITADDDVRTAIACMKAGACNYIVKPLDFDELLVDVEKALEDASLKGEFRRLQHEREVESQSRGIVGESEPMLEVFNLLGRIVRSDATTILLQGESGTGKDLFARAVHYGSSRKGKSFIEVNCAALPETLLESELMGHEKGAFTDAKTAKKGCFELADGGTIYLDEISEMKPAIQAKLLRIIENKRFKRLGGTQDIEVDVRIIAATNRDLRAALIEGRFREDLYYRLKVIPIVLPPLRERSSDIPLLVSHFIDKFNRTFKRDVKGISPQAQRLIVDYRWPGNVRELQNVIERVIILESDDLILPEHLPAELRNAHRPSSAPQDLQIKLPSSGISLERLEEDLLRQALSLAEGNQTEAARLLGLGRDALRYRMKKTGILS